MPGRCLRGRPVTWMTVGFIALAGLLLSGCITQKQRAYVTVIDPEGRTTTRIYCTQRNTMIAAFGANQELHKMSGVCGDFEGDSNQVGFDEEGRKAFESAVKAGVCAATGGAGCALDGLGKLQESFLER